MRVDEETFEKVFGQSVEETLKETCEEGFTARSRKVEALPSRKQVEERNVDHAVSRSWRPHCCVTGRAEAYGHEETRRRRRSSNDELGLYSHAQRAGEGGGEGNADNRGDG